MFLSSMIETLVFFFLFTSRFTISRFPLQVKSLLPARSIASVLGDLLTPPSPSAVASALSTLTSLRALAQNPETLTPLGRHLARIPVDVRAGKMLVFGAVLGCPGPAATIAAALAGKSPFAAVPPDVRDEADRVKRRLAGTWKSDHLAAVAAFEGWRAAGRDGGWRAQQEFCQVSEANSIGSAHVANVAVAPSRKPLSWYQSFCTRRLVPDAYAVSPQQKLQVTSS